MMKLKNKNVKKAVNDSKAIIKQFELTDHPKESFNIYLDGYFDGSRARHFDELKDLHKRQRRRLIYYTIWGFVWVFIILFDLFELFFKSQIK